MNFTFSTPKYGQEFEWSLEADDLGLLIEHVPIEDVRTLVARNAIGAGVTDLHLKFRYQHGTVGTLLGLLERLPRRLPHLHKIKVEICAGAEDPRRGNFDEFYENGCLVPPALNELIDYTREVKKWRDAVGAWPCQLVFQVTLRVDFEALKTHAEAAEEIAMLLGKRFGEATVTGGGKEVKAMRGGIGVKVVVGIIG